MVDVHGPGGFDHLPRRKLLGSTQPNEVLSIMFADPDAGCPSSLATVYASVFGRQAFAAVRLNLIACARGHRGVIASAFVTPGWNGPCIIATGVCCESWHVEAQGAEDAELTATLVARQCCSSFSVWVPPDLLQQDQLPQDTMSGLRVPPMPWAPDRGYYSVQGGAVSPPNVTVEARTRVLRIWAHAPAGGPVGTVAANFGAQVFTLQVPAGANGVEVIPRGNLVGPGTIVFTGTDSYVVEQSR